MPLDGTAPGLHVLVLNDYCYVQGGASKVAIDEAVALAHAGLRVTFLGAVGPPCQALLDAPLDVVCLDQPELLDVARHPAALFRSMLNPVALRRTASLLRGADPARTVVHLHGYTKALSTSPMLAARRHGIAAICTLHDFYAACPNGAFFDYTRQAPCLRQALSLSCMAAHCDKRAYAHKLFRVARGLVQRGAAGFPRSVREYITLSGKSAAVLRPYLPADARLHPLENIIDAQPAPPSQPGTSRQFLFVGRLDQEKGVALLAQAAQAEGLAITFAGDGPMRAAVAAVPGMQVTGWLSPAEIRARLSGARCLVFPSLWYEAYGLVVAEAAAQGIPAIVSDVSAAAERVQHGVTGWHFRSGDATSLAACLRLVADADAAVAAAGRAAYAAFWANPSTASRHTEGLVRIYRSILPR